MPNEVRSSEVRSLDGHMVGASYHIRGREIDDGEIDYIRGLIRESGSLGRTALSRHLCERWGWRQANGLLKDRACRVLLLALEAKGLIQLPPRLKNQETFNRKRVADFGEISQEAIFGRVADFGSLTIKMVRFTPEEKFWDYLVHTHHYLGHPWIVGSYLKYLAYLDDRLVACLGWGSASWKVACRDSFIGWSASLRKKNLPKLVNNVRFLILPWVRVEHLASKVLALNIRCLAADWRSFYGEDILLLETFVDTSRFQGTCYRAANWRCVGQTKGRSRNDRYNRLRVPVKDVYLYPLTRDFRESLNA